VEMLQQLWPILELVFARHGTDSRVMEKLCRCYKHTARNCGPGFRPLVPRLLPQVSGWFEQQPHSCFIYVCNVCISSFGDAVELRAVFAEVFVRLSLSTFKLLSVNPTSLPDNPDVVDDYFELCSKVLRRQPSLLLESQTSPPLLLTVFQCGCAGLHIQHREAARAVVCFFEVLVGLCSSDPRRSQNVSPAGLAALQGVLSEHGVHLVVAIIRSIAGVVPPSRIRFLMPVLRSLAGISADTCRVWVESAIQSLPADVHTDGATMVASIFSSEAMADEKVYLNAVDAFSSACRRKRVL